MNDLTVGKPLGLLVRFSLPLVLSSAVQQLYSIADSIIVGKLDSADGLAAIGAAYPITLFFIAVATGASMGCSVVISHLYGAKRMTDVKSAIYTAILSMVVLGAVMDGLGVGLSRPLMLLLRCDGQVLDRAASYLAIYSAGVLPLFVYNTANAVFTGLGDGKRPLYFLIFSSVLNVILDLIAVGPMQMGVVGAALATAVSQLAAALLSSGILIRKVRQVKTQEKPALFHRELFGRMCRMAVPSICQQGCVALGSTVIQSLVNSFGAAVMAGYAAASKVDQFSYMCFTTMGTALSSYAAQNYGANRPERIREGVRTACMLCLGLAVAVLLIMQLLAGPLVGLFTDPSEAQYEEILRVGTLYMRIVSPDYLLVCFVVVLGGLLRGLGLANKFLLVTLLDFTVRVAMCFVLCSALDSYTGLYWAWYFGSTIDLGICLYWYVGLCRRGCLRLESAEQRTGGPGQTS
ncbi:MAG: MATE family efflux transporter [Oscillospiraceae bacterium]|nr:MATE family efflux transporter [Oscillospiraceae bacterium]